MKSSIKVHLRPIENGVGLQPVIAVKLISIVNGEDEDQRDYTLKAFFEQLGHTSKWLEVKFDHHISSGENLGSVSGEDKKFITILPIAPSRLPRMVEEAKNMMDFQGYNVHNNSHGFYAFLDKEKIAYKANGHFTLIMDSAIDLFNLGVQYAEYKQKYPTGVTN